MSFALTPNAAQFMQRMLRFSATPTAAFRLRVRPSNSAQLSSEYDIEEPAPDSAELMVIGGVRMLVDFRTQGLLAGATVDLSDNLLRSGFVFLLAGK